MVTRPGWKPSPATIDPDPLGREGRAQRGLCPALASSNGKEERLRRVLHFQEHGGRPDLPHHRAEISHQGANYRILANQWSRFTHYYFYIHDEVLGPIVLRVASFFPFRTTYYLNGHNFVEHQLRHAKIGFRKNDNAFVAVDDVAVLQAAADKLSPDIIRGRLDYWTFRPFGTLRPATDPKNVRDRILLQCLTPKPPTLITFL